MLNIPVVLCAMRGAAEIVSSSHKQDWPCSYHIRSQPQMSTPSIHDALRQRLPPPTLAHRQRLHILLQVQVQVLEHEVQLMTVGVHNVEQTDDVGVDHLFQEGNLADGGGGYAFVFGFETDLLQGDDALVRGGQVAGFVYDAVCACKPSKGRFLG